MSIMMSSTRVDATEPHAAHGSTGALLRSFVIGLTAFLTVVDLFATQAILPSLAKAYQVSPAAIGFAVNASTIGMAVAGLAVAFFSHRVDRRRGSRLFHARPDSTDARSRNTRAIATLDLGRTSAQRALARELRHRIPDPLCVHRNFHLRELRARARTSRLEPYGSGFRLLRFP